MQHRPAAPAFVLAASLVAGGALLALFLLTDHTAVGVLGLCAVAAGVVAALVGLLRLAVGIDYLTYRELEREAGRDFVLDASSELDEAGQRAAARQGLQALTHEARMAKIRAAAAEPSA